MGLGQKYTLEIALPLSDQVADILRHQILSGHLKKGQKISERQISSQLDVSTAPVKSAIQTLKVEGLLQTIPHRGTFVNDIFLSNLSQMIHLRSVIEGTAAYWGAKHIIDEDLQLMEQKLNFLYRVGKGEIAKDEKVMDRLRKENYSFHKILSLSANNTYLNQLIENMDSINNTIRNLYYNVSDDDEILNSYDDHKRIFLAAKNRDGAAAEQATVEHIRRVVDSLEVELESMREE